LPRLPQHLKSDAALSDVNKPNEQFTAGRSDAAMKMLPFPARNLADIDFYVPCRVSGMFKPTNARAGTPQYARYGDNAMARTIGSVD
jgi:hypothetical protein